MSHSLAIHLHILFTCSDTLNNAEFERCVFSHSLHIVQQWIYGLIFIYCRSTLRPKWNATIIYFQSQFREPHRLGGKRF